MKTALIIHGHFYQPPREDPSTGIVDSQQSAKPYANWNDAVYKTCYKPNAYSRYLANDGKVEAIYNNYSTISSNFGPTLLNWMDDAHPHFIEKLREADRESIQKYGHSNFIAQTYNHVILPLESRKDKVIQVQWALEDYKTRFGHESEGFWCSECAIDLETIDVLAENNIKFVILSPWQAKLPKGQCAPSDRPFILKGKEKSIAAFFYNGDFASGISFGHLLRDADALYQNIVSYRKEHNCPKLLSWATDGEIYGHHEAFGDMALAALIKKVNEGDEFYFTNYAAYLEANPPKEEIELYLGEDGKGSSWSCSHGVKRWYTDCGCHTGGNDSWNQAWRTPLRNALNNLEVKARIIFDENVRRFLGQDADSERILLNYKKVLTHQQTIDQYMKSLGLNEESSEELAVLLDSMKNIFFSFTSCGWFFNDISGIEPRQDIAYAVYAATNLQRFTSTNILPALLKDLKDAKSNIPSEGTGETIAKYWVSIIPAFARACGFFAMNRLTARSDDYENKYGVFQLVSIKDQHLMTLKNTNTCETFNLSYDAHLNENGVFIISVKNLKNGYDYSYEGAQISLKSLQTYAKWVDNNLGHSVDQKTLCELSTCIKNFLVLADLKSTVAKENIFYENLSLSVKVLKSIFLEKNKISWEERTVFLKQVARTVKRVGRSSDIDSMTNFFTYQLNRCSRLFRNHKIVDLEIIHMLDILQIARENNYYTDITELQNEVWSIIQGVEKTNLSKELLNRVKVQLNFKV